jgi:1-aminocyclopropane-1-carboxylate deaminase/D-cysteine desulfhydrase-like pyridoxal-dependent ACC family enzyme
MKSHARVVVEAVKMTAQFEGILLDRVYSGKGFSGLINLIRKGYFKQDEKNRIPANWG